MTPLLTERLILRPFTLQDAPFILRLLNEPSFIANIADKGVRTLEQAETYLREGPLTSYATHGHGLWWVGLRKEGTPVGMCGIIRRETLPERDLGYAFLPEWWGQGLAREAAHACVEHAQQVLGAKALLAIITPTNLPSIRLVEALGFLPQGEVAWTPGDPLRLFRLALD